MPGFAGTAAPRRAAASMPSCRHQVQHAPPGRSAPQRVPIGRPSSAEKPMVVAMLRPACMRAERGAVAEMRDHHPPCRELRRRLRQDARRCIRRTGRGSRSGGCRASAISRGSAKTARPRGWCGGRRCRSRPPAARRARVPSRRGWARGCAAGAAARAATSVASSSISAGVTRAGAAWSRPAMHDAMADRGERAARRASRCSQGSSASQRLGWSSRGGRSGEVGARRASPGAVARRRAPAARRCPSTWP